jgi:hypothetical protein
MTPRPLSMAPLDWLMLIGLSFLWGGAFFLNKIAFAELPPLTVAFARVGIAAVIPLAIAWMRDELRPVRTAWPTFILLGLVNSASRLRSSPGGKRILQAALPRSSTRRCRCSPS